MIVLIGAPVTGSACPALTPPLGVALAPLTPVFGVGLDLVGGTVSTCAVGLVALGAGLVGPVDVGVVGVAGVARAAVRTVALCVLRRGPVQLALSLASLDLRRVDGAVPGVLLHVPHPHGTRAPAAETTRCAQASRGVLPRPAKEYDPGRVREEG